MATESIFHNIVIDDTKKKTEFVIISAQRRILHE